MAATATSLPETAAEEPEARGPSRRPLALLVLLALVASSAVWWFVLRDPAAEEMGETPAEGMVVEVAQMTANLSGNGMNYVRFSFALVLAEGYGPPDVEPRYALLKDAALSVAQTFSEEHLRTPQGTDEFRAQLTERARALFADGEVLRVVLTELLVQ